MYSEWGWPTGHSDSNARFSHLEKHTSPPVTTPTWSCIVSPNIHSKNYSLQMALYRLKLDFWHIKVLQRFFMELFPNGAMYDTLKTRFDLNWNIYFLKTILHLCGIQTGIWATNQITCLSGRKTVSKTGDVFYTSFEMQSGIGLKMFYSISSIKNTKQSVL